MAFNKLWFKKRLITVRTSKYDDYFNGIDEIIFDTKTFQPLAAVDTTLDPMIKANELMNKITRGGELKYGLEMNPQGIKKKSCKNLPFFIISIKLEDCLSLASDIFQGQASEEGEKIKNEVLKSILLQSEKFQDIASTGVKSSYQNVKEIFQELSKE